jgi:hypothetical protein
MVQASSLCAAGAPSAWVISASVTAVAHDEDAEPLTHRCDVGAHGALRRLGDAIEAAGVERQLSRVQRRDGAAGLRVRPRNGDDGVETAWPAQRGIDRVEPIGRPEQKHAAQFLDAVDLGQ